MSKWKKIVKVLFFTLSGIGIIVLLGFVNKMNNEQKCKSISIEIDQSDQLYFIDNEDVLHALHDQGNVVVGQQAGSIDLADLEKRLRNHPHIRNAEVSLSINGELKVIVKQRTPVLRVINAKDESFYIDDEGKLMPLSDKYTAKVPVANGFIFESYDKFYPFCFADTAISEEFKSKVVLDDLFQIADFIRKDSFWKAQIQQIYVDKEIELVPRVGNQQIILGDNSDLGEKFEKLKVFYSQAMPKVGWNAYRTINLKFKGQVVCKKAL